MPTEWLRVMLDEIARKRAEADRAREEEALRRSAGRAERRPPPPPRRT
jgi:hypothetical protein